MPFTAGNQLNQVLQVFRYSSLCTNIPFPRIASAIDTYIAQYTVETSFSVETCHTSDRQLQVLPTYGFRVVFPSQFAPGEAARRMPRSAVRMSHPQVGRRQPLSVGHP